VELSSTIVSAQSDNMLRRPVSGLKSCSNSDEGLSLPFCDTTLPVDTIDTPAAHVEDNSFDSGVSGAKLSEPEASVKREILSLARTLKLTGWDKVPLHCSGSIDLKKLSGTYCMSDQ
jgi:Choline kinase N terminus